MKLQKITIKNFRGLKGENNIINFSVSNIIFLVGQNNVGKSTFLRGYEFFIAPKQKAEKTDFYNYDNKTPIEIEAEFLVEKDDAKDKDLMKGEENSQQPDWVNKNWADKEGIVKIKKIWKSEDSIFEKYTWNPNTRKWELNGFGGLHQYLQKYAPEPIPINAMETEDSLEEKVNNLINKDFLKTAKDDFKSSYEVAEKAVRELQKKVLGTAKIKNINTNINRVFGEVFTNLELEIKPKHSEINLVDSLKKDHSVGVKTAGSTRDETFKQHGHGIIRQALFNFIAFLKSVSKESTKKEYLILFEEPELFLHPKVAYALRKSLYNLSVDSPYQVLCATHSPLMIDISRPKSSLVRVVKDQNEETQTYQVGDELFQKNTEYKQMVQMINRFNSNICEVFYADNVLLVEGDTEAIVYRDLLDRFYEEKGIYVLNTGSKNNIPFFQEVLTHFQIKHAVIHDTDVPSKSSAWSLNEKIWKKVEEANKVCAGLARRYVFADNFEITHGYDEERKKTDGKPLAAYKFVSGIKAKDEEQPCLNILKDLFEEVESLNHNQEYIKNLELGEDEKEEKE